MSEFPVVSQTAINSNIPTTVVAVDVATPYVVVSVVIIIIGEPITHFIAYKSIWYV